MSERASSVARERRDSLTVPVCGEGSDPPRLGQNVSSIKNHSEVTRDRVAGASFGNF